MTEIKKQALTLVNECGFHGGYIDRKWNEQYEALCRALEQSAALQAEFDHFRQEVSDAVEAWRDADVMSKVSAAAAKLHSFILPKPKADPLVEAWLAVWPGDTRHDAEEMCAKLHKAMETMNAKIVEAE